MTAPADDSPGLLLATLARVLQPLVRLAIARGITYQMASELLKRVYVEAAQKHFVEGDATGTRLSLLTGLNRKEIRRLTTDGDEKRPEDMASFASAVHGLWSGHRRWRDREGKPKPLPRHGNGRNLSFDDLVRSVTADHRPSAVLDELTRLGFAREEDGMVILDPRPFGSLATFADRLLPLGENLEDHAKAAVANVLAEGDARPPFLEHAVFSDELSTGSVAHLSRVAQEQWKGVRETMLEEAIQAEATDADAGREPAMRIRVGMYFYAEKNPPPAKE